MKNPLKNKIFFSRIWLFGYFPFGSLAEDTSLHDKDIVYHLFRYLLWVYSDASYESRKAFLWG